MHLVHNERTKLTASWLNTLATAFVAAGAFAPLVAWIYGFSEVPVSAPSLFVAAFACGAGGLGIHIFGWAMLGSLRE